MENELEPLESTEITAGTFSESQVIYVNSDDLPANCRLDTVSAFEAATTDSGQVVLLDSTSSILDASLLPGAAGVSSTTVSEPVNIVSTIQTADSTTFTTEQIEQPASKRGGKASNLSALAVLSEVVLSDSYTLGDEGQMVRVQKASGDEKSSECPVFVLSSASQPMQATSTNGTTIAGQSAVSLNSGHITPTITITKNVKTPLDTKKKKSLLVNRDEVVDLRGHVRTVKKRISRKLCAPATKRAKVVPPKQNIPAPTRPVVPVEESVVSAHPHTQVPPTLVFETKVFLP